MKKFLIRSVLFLVPLGLGVYLVSLYNQSFIFEQNLSESNAAITPINTHFKYVLMGTSQSRTFTRENNYVTSDSVIGRGGYLNLSQGGGGGIIPSLVSMNYFFDRGNSVDQVIYFVTPRVFFTRYSNENHKMFHAEPFQLDLFYEIFSAPYIPWKTKKQYLCQLKNFNWQEENHWGRKRSDSALDVFDMAAEEKGKKVLAKYLTETPGNFDRYMRLNDELVSLLKRHGARIKYVFLPDPMDEVPGLAKVKKGLLDRGYTVFDHSKDMLEPSLFSDHLHLNAKGVRSFLNNYWNELK
jgi:hypothetical protein